MLELLVLKKGAQRTSQRVKWTSGSRVMIIFDRSVARSLGRSGARSLGRSIAGSLDRSLDRSMDRSLESHTGNTEHAPGESFGGC